MASRSGGARDDAQQSSFQSGQVSSGLTMAEHGRDSSAAVSVSVRLRPPVSRAEPAVRVATNGSLNVQGREYHGFLTSLVTGSDQSVAYRAIAAPLLDQLKRGYSCTLLAYGQTGSGKTHTIFGPTGSLTEASLSEALDADGVPFSWGLFPRVALALLRMGAGTLYASAVEIYGEHAYDLLNARAPLSVGTKKAGRSVGGGPTCLAHQMGTGAASSGAVGNAANFHGVHPPACRCQNCHAAKKAELAARLAKRDALQSKAGGGGFAGAIAGGASSPRAAGGDDEEVGTVGETRVELATAADVAKLARTVEVTRVAVGHLLNARSSRSHCFVHLHLSEKRGGAITRRQFVCVDLAGSERILRTGVEGIAQKQAVCINSSLTTLGKVVKAVGERSPHVPYRDSTLTQLLRGSLGGKSRTSVVIAVASDAEHVDETVCSIEFGRRMQVVRNNTAVVVGQDAAAEARSVQMLLFEARAELARLEADGHGERFGESADKPAVAQFKENVRRKAGYDAEAVEARSMLAEAKAGGGGGERAAAWRARAERAEAESDNLRDIVLRQKSIKGLWTAPKASYLKKAAEVRELEARLRGCSIGTE